MTTYQSSSGSIRNDIPENDADLFNHAAVLAVRLVGSYTNEQILEAVALLKSNQKDVFNASNLMQCLIDIEDLEEEAKQQKEKNERNMKDAEIEELRLRTKCKVCLEEELKIVFLPCGHLCTCVDCASHLERCPVCREQKRSTVKAYLT
ncbi:baculoviral IAP repeat-containing protein 7-like [Pecten maximus]|uniref:baculoviral IAP repeat-containing protein 7-like n=1 Tax=Pecten maximus TaxID=6579 RepID=UPI0014583DF1|nr:baculoviral IAP repeat-containing protein 7-like [Pecten maximus]